MSKQTIEVKTKAITILQKAGYPVSIGYMAYQLKVSWGTARNILFVMAWQNQISAIETSKGYVFKPRECLQ
jgi:hypothetical protein